MAVDVSMIADGEFLDYQEVEGLPISFKVKSDKFTQIGGAGGKTVDNIAKSITLPATKKNSKAFNSPHNPLKDSKCLVDDFDVLVNGANVFSGSAVVKKGKKNSKYPENYVLELYGDGVSFWNKLDGVSMKDLKTVMGTEDWTWANIRSSWVESYDDGRCGIWAPVLYGCPTESITIINQPDTPCTAFDSDDFRFHVYFKCILDAIGKFCGYSFKSEFADTWLFKETVYLWGDGYNYETVGISQCLVEASGVSQLINLQATVRYSTVDQDTCGELDASSGLFTADRSNVYDFTFNGGIDGGMFGLGIANVLVNGLIVETFFPIQGEYNTSFSLGLTAGDIVQIEIIGTGELINYNFTASAENTSLTGSTLLIGSTFHDKPVKEWLKGIAHMFNLAFHVDNTCKQICMEPRFDYKLKREYESEYVHYKGFYNSLHLIDQKPQRLPINIESLSFDRSNPYGNGLKLGYQKDEDDPIASRYYNDNDQETPVYGTLTKFKEVLSDCAENLNPYFCDLFQYNPNLPIATTLPAVLPSDWEYGTPLPEGEDRTYESCPKTGLVYRDNAVIIINETGQSETVTVPWISQQATSFVPNGQALEKCISLSYSDTIAEWPLFGTDQRVTGLTGTFFYQWLAIMRNYYVLKASFALSACDVGQENFRRLKQFPVCGNQTYWILMCINGFRPTRPCPTELELIEYVCPTIDDAMQTDHWDSPPYGVPFCELTVTSATHQCSPSVISFDWDGEGLPSIDFTIHVLNAGVDCGSYDLQTDVDQTFTGQANAIPAGHTETLPSSFAGQNFVLIIEAQTNPPCRDEVCILNGC